MKKLTFRDAVLITATLTMVASATISAQTVDHTNDTLSKLLDPTSTRVFIAAHRGGYESDKEDKAPENSIANIENCEGKGYEIFETDIQRTKDGHFVIVHDPTIERETSGVGEVSEMPLHQLKRLHKRWERLLGTRCDLRGVSRSWQRPHGVQS